MKRRNIFRSIFALPFLPLIASGSNKKKRVVAQSHGVFINGIPQEAFFRVWSTAEICGLTKNEVCDLFHRVKRIEKDRDYNVIANAMKSVFTRLSRQSTLDEIYNITGKRLSVDDNMFYRMKSIADLVYTLDRRRGEGTKIKELSSGVFQWFIIGAYWHTAVLDEQIEWGRKLREYRFGQSINAK